MNVEMHKDPQEVSTTTTETDTRSEAMLFEARGTVILQMVKRLDRLLAVLKELEADLDDMEQSLNATETLHEDRQNELNMELILVVDAYNHLRESANLIYRRIILHRESCGFRGHDAIRRSYPIPDLRLPPYLMDSILFS